MLPTEFFALRILASLIPKSLRAGIALAVLLIFFPLGLNELADVLLGQASVWAIVKSIGGLIVGGIAGLVFLLLSGNRWQTEGP